jgi:CubicO group peptidase (beta-lactamase class C family)
MENSALMFIPLVFWLLAAGGGFVCMILATFALHFRRPPRLRQLTRDVEPPLPADVKQRAAPSFDFWGLCLKGFLAVGLGSLVSGLLGIWSTKVSIGWERNPVAEWSDGRAPELEPLIRKRCVPFIQSGKSIGMAAAVVTPGKATIMTFGHPKLSSAAPTRADTLFEIGSITKTFTALALAREIERGMVRLEQPVQELLPAGVQLPEPARAITLRQLTTHTSGFPRMAANVSPIVGLKMLLFGSDPYAGYTAGDLMQGVRTVKLEFKPGTVNSYSNFGMTLLGQLLAAKAGSSYEALIKGEVCRPLGMSDTTITLDAAQKPRVAEGYRAVWRLGPLVVALRSDPWFEANDLGGAGALRTSATDLLKYLQANMHPDGLPLEKAIRESHRELFKQDERLAWAMNWLRLQGETLKQTVIWHNGGTGGFRSYLGFAERSRVGVLVLSNATESVDDLSADLLRELANK